jgi:carbon-monoxide dehydrogenase medium subunit
MIPAAFEYARAESVDHAIELLSSNEDAKILAGGHSLLPLMRLRLARPSMLIDIGRVSDLSGIRADGDVVVIGALTRHHDVANSEVLQELCPIVAHTAGEIGDPQVRHMGTIGGSIAHADPASDMPTVLMALGAEMVVAAPAGHAHRGGRRLLQGPVHARPGGERGADRGPRASHQAPAGATSSSIAARRTGPSWAWQPCRATAVRTWR